MSSGYNNSYQSHLTSRRFSRRTLFLGAATAGIGAAGLMLVGCGDDDESTLDRAKDENRIRIGFANEAPYGYADASGNVTGEAPEVAREVFRRMGIEEVDALVVPFGSLIPGLQAGRFDVIAAGMFINPDRCEQIRFSDPDYCIPQAFGVEEGNPLGLASYEDVAANPDVKLGVIAGAVEEGYASALGVSGNQIIAFDDVANLPEAVRAGQIDAFAATSLSVRAQVDRVSGLEATPAFVPVIDGADELGCGGYGFRTDDEDLHKEFNDILVEMKGNNEVVAITSSFGFLDDEIGAARDKTAEDLCTP
jgi:polar amino acid transport system substrate-binding protein